MTGVVKPILQGVGERDGHPRERWNRLVPARESRRFDFQEFCEPVVKHSHH